MSRSFFCSMEKVKERLCDYVAGLFLWDEES